MSVKPRLALIGCGDMGYRHLRAYVEMKKLGANNFDYVALCDSLEERVKERVALLRKELDIRIPWYTSYEKLLEKEDIDAVDVVTIERTHHEIALQAVEANKHVMVEKPMGITVRACRKMVDAAKRNGRTLAVAHNLRRLPGNRVVEHLLGSGIVGEPYLTAMVSIAPTGNQIGRGPATGIPTPYRFDKLQIGSYAMLLVGVHESDLQRYWFGEAKEAYGIIRTFEKERILKEPEELRVKVSTEDAAFGLITFRNGLPSQITMTQAGRGEAYDRRIINCSKGSISSNHRHDWMDGFITLDDGVRIPSGDFINSFLLAGNGDLRERLFPRGTWIGEYRYEKANPMRYGVAVELHDFADALAKKRKPEVTGDEGLKSVALSYAVIESASLGEVVNVKDVEEDRVNGYQEPINDALKIS